MGATVLVADDDETVRDAVSWCLGSEGFRVLTAADGAEAVRRCSKAAVDIFILDVHMPILDGAGALEQIRAKARFQDTPVLFLTACPQDAPAGVVALAKPCGVDQLIQAVKSALESSQRRLAERSTDRRRARPRGSMGDRAGNRSSAAGRK
jgi:CheY-like chemotaxis protein